MSEKTNAVANQKKHARRRRRCAEQHWDKLKANGLCPICREHTPNQALCDSCGDCHTVFITDYVDQRGQHMSSTVWIYVGVPSSVE